MAVYAPERTEVEAPAKPKHPEFLRAAELVRQSWGQGKEGLTAPPNGTHCAMTAIWAAERRSESFGGYGGYLPEVLARSIGLHSPVAIAAWNDAPERTAEEVAEALERAAWGL